MNFISEMTWTQLLLIEAGVVMQVVALRAILRKASAYGEEADSHEEAEDVIPISKSDKKNLVLAALYRPEQVPVDAIPQRDAQADFRAGSLAKTAKVKFQKFQFRPH